MRPVSLITGLFLLAGTAVTAHAEPNRIVEMFTSKFCPNCPAAEKKMLGIAKETPDLLVLFEHVDYWDHDGQKDPYGTPENTQRQYDYSNTVSKRPGQVFTPMPIIDGSFVAAPPLWLSWEKTLTSALSEPAPAKLSIKKVEMGLTVTIPPSITTKNTEMALLGADRIDGENAWRVMTIQPIEVKSSSVHISKALMPPTDLKVILLQQIGPGKVLGMGITR